MQMKVLFSTLICLHVLQLGNSISNGMLYTVHGQQSAFCSLNHLSSRLKYLIKKVCMTYYITYTFLEAENPHKSK